METFSSYMGVKPILIVNASAYDVNIYCFLNSIADNLPPRSLMHFFVHDCIV